MRSDTNREHGTADHGKHQTYGRRVTHACRTGPKIGTSSLEILVFDSFDISEHIGKELSAFWCTIFGKAAS